MLVPVQSKDHVQPFMFSLAMAHSQLPALAIASHQNVYNFKSWINTIEIQEESKCIFGSLKFASVLKSVTHLLKQNKICQPQRFNTAWGRWGLYSASLNILTKSQQEGCLCSLGAFKH